MPTIGLDDQQQGFADIQQAFREYRTFRRRRSENFAQASFPDSIPVATFEEVLDIFHVSDTEGLAKALSDLMPPYEVEIYEDVLADSGNAAMFVGLGHSGIALYLDGDGPDDFASVLTGISEAADTEDYLELGAFVGTYIESVEGFRVLVSCLDWTGEWDIPEPLLYPFRRAAPSHWTVEQWLEMRAIPHAPTWELSPRFPDGHLAEPSTRLRDLRQK